jgi:DNA-binding LytR/AlgR family response regulator
VHEELKIALCDDNPAELRQIRTIVQEFVRQKQSVCSMSVHEFSSGSDLFLFTKKHGAFDLVILDIIMPGLSGLELAVKLRAHNDDCRIIFLTSSSDFAVDSYKVKAYYYLLKNSAHAELPVLLGRALDDITKESVSSIVIKEKGQWTRIALSSIQYVESVNHSVVFHLRKNETAVCFSRFSGFLETLLADKRFVQCHRSFIVNMQHVTGITGKDFILEDGSGVPISRNAYPQIKNEYLDYFFTKMK